MGYITGADLGFSRGGADFQKKNRKFCQPFFIGRQKWFPELSQSTKKSLFWSTFLRRRQNFEKKTGQKDLFRHFLEKFYQKIEFFRGALPP